jgi:hypothetical protein
MTKPATDKPVRRKRQLTSYTIVWSLLGALGLSYLGVALFEPAWLGDLTPESSHHEIETQNALADISNDIAGIRSSIANLQLDVAAVKGDLTSQTEQTHQLASQLSALEDKVRLGQTQVASVAADDTPATDQKDEESSKHDGKAAKEQEASSKPPAKPVKIINAAPKDSSPIETGSVTPPKKPKVAKARTKPVKAKAEVINFGPAVVKPAPAAIGIEIGSAPSVGGLRLSWSQIIAHNAELQDLQARYAETDDPANPGYNLIAGPLKSRAEAKRICQDLIARYQTCRIGEFKGEAL